MKNKFSDQIELVKKLLKGKFDPTEPLERFFWTNLYKHLFINWKRDVATIPYSTLSKNRYVVHVEHDGVDVYRVIIFPQNAPKSSISRVMKYLVNNPKGNLEDERYCNIFITINSNNSNNFISLEMSGSVEIAQIRHHHIQLGLDEEGDLCYGFVDEKLAKAAFNANHALIDGDGRFVTQPFMVLDGEVFDVEWTLEKVF